MGVSDFKIAQHIEVYKDNEIIFSEGSKGRDMYVIISGDIEISQIINNKPFTLSILEPGDFFGEMSTIRGVPRVATAKAIGKVEVIKVSPEIFKSMIQHKPGFGVKIIKELCNRIDSGNKKIEKLSLLNQMERIIVMLSNLATDYGAKPFKSIKIVYDNALNEIALKTKADKETVGKIIASLAKYNRIGVVEEDGIKYIGLTDKLLRHD